MAVFIKREYDYAIRICAYLAGIHGEGHKSVSEIARKLYITVPFTTKIVHQLKNRQLVETIQGKQGGIRLRREPDTISFFDVLNAMGFDSSLNECVKIPGLCPLVVNCKIHRFFMAQEKALLDNLKSARISEFSFSEADLRVPHTG